VNLFQITEEEAKGYVGPGWQEHFLWFPVASLEDLLDLIRMNTGYQEEGLVENGYF